MEATEQKPRTFSFRAIVSRARATAQRTLAEAARILSEETATNAAKPSQNPRSKDE